jgi:hypothetical protein
MRSTRVLVVRDPKALVSVRPGKSYHGRGPIQLPEFELRPCRRRARLDLCAILIESKRCDRRVEDGDLVLMTATLPRPSAHDVMTGAFRPSTADVSAGRFQGLATMNLVNGNLNAGDPRING